MLKEEDQQWSGQPTTDHASCSAAPKKRRRGLLFRGLAATDDQRFVRTSFLPAKDVTESRFSGAEVGP